MQGWICGEAARSFWSWAMEFEKWVLRQTILPPLRKAAPKEGADLGAPIESCSPYPASVLFLPTTLIMGVPYPG
jgi:hypothetical protein